MKECILLLNDTGLLCDPDATKSNIIQFLITFLNADLSVALHMLQFGSSIQAINSFVLEIFAVRVSNISL